MTLKDVNPAHITLHKGTFYCMKAISWEFINTIFFFNNMKVVSKDTETSRIGNGAT